MTEKTFAELYCIKEGIAEEQFEKVVLARTLYPHAKLVAPLVRLLWPDFFAADIDFVRSVGRLRKFREFFNEAEEFAHHPANRGFLRLTVNIRISSRSVRRMVRLTLHPDPTVGVTEAGDVTAVPFGDRKEPEAPAAGAHAPTGQPK